MRAPEISIYRSEYIITDLNDLKEKIKGYKMLYGQEPRLFVSGDWYSWIDGVEFPDFSIHSHGEPFEVVKMGTKFITLKSKYPLGTKSDYVKVLFVDGSSGWKRVVLQPRN